MEFLGLSQEQFESIPQDVRDTMISNGIPNLESLMSKSSASQSRLKPAGQGMSV